MPITSSGQLIEFHHFLRTLTPLTHGYWQAGYLTLPRSTSGPIIYHLDRGRRVNLVIGNRWLNRNARATLSAPSTTRAESRSDSVGTAASCEFLIANLRPVGWGLEPCLGRNRDGAMRIAVNFGEFVLHKKWLTQHRLACII